MRRPKALTTLYRLLLFFILPAAGCRPGNAGADHPGYMDSAVRASNVRIKDSAAYFHVVDSVFHGLASPGAGDRWDYYYLRYCYYFYQAKRNNRAMQLADTLTRLGALVQDESRRRRYMARSILMEGDVFQAQQLYAQAMDKFIAARQLIAPTSDSCGLADYTHSLAIATYNRQHFAEALVYEKALLAEQRACDDTTQFKSVEHLQGNLDNVGICYVRLGQAGPALEYFDAALRCIGAAEKRFPRRKEFLVTARAVVQGNKADAFLLKGDTASAEKLLRESVQVNRGAGHEPEDALFSLLKLGRVYLRQTRLREAQRVVQEIDSALPGVRTPELHLRWARLAFACDSAAGDWEHAAKAAQYILRWQDSLAALAVKSDLVNMRTGLSVREKSARMPLLERQNTVRAWMVAILSVCLAMGIAIIILVIRLYRQSQKHLRELNSGLAALEKSQEANTRIMKVVAHDLRNPLGTMTTMADILLRQQDHSAETQEFLRLMLRSGQDAVRLIDELLQFQVSSSVFVPEPMQLKDLLEYCILLNRSKAEAKGQRIDLFGPAVAISADREKLWRVFSNLVANAVKFSPEGGEITVLVTPSPHSVVVTVKDNGIGIPDSMKEQIFNPAAGRKGTAGEATFGLGLAIARQIVGQHRGRIWFESIEGRGTAFFVELPREMGAG